MLVCVEMFFFKIYVDNVQTDEVTVTYCQHSVIFTASAAHAEFRPHVTSHALHHIQGLDLSAFSFCALLPKQVLISNTTIGVQVGLMNMHCVSSVGALTWLCLGLNMQELPLSLPAKPD